MRFKRVFLAAACLATASLTVLPGCATAQMDPAVADASSPEKVKAFETKLGEVARTLPREPGYRRIPLDSKADQQWFTTQAFLLWDGRQSSAQFVAAGEQRFPGYKSSFEAVARALLR